MSATETLAAAQPYRAREFHAFESAGLPFVYLVPSGAIFALETIGRDILDCLASQRLIREELVERLVARGHQSSDIETALTELESADAIASADVVPIQPQLPSRTFPLQRIVLNVTNQSTLACTYSFEYTEDKIAKTQGNPKNLTSWIAESAIDLL